MKHHKNYFQAKLFQHKSFKHMQLYDTYIWFVLNLNLHKTKEEEEENKKKSNQNIQTKLLLC